MLLPSEKTSGRKSHIQLAGYIPQQPRTPPGVSTTPRILVFIDIRAAMADGVSFFVDKNGIIITRGVDSKGTLPPDYITEITTVVEPRKLVWRPGRPAP